MLCFRVASYSSQNAEGQSRYHTYGFLSLRKTVD